MKFSKNIRDPVHGTIALSDLELALLDTPHLQRLRNIKQNGFCYLVYPAMNSSRFEHSLGITHLAGLLSDHLGVTEKDRAKIRAAALLHDIGHCAFSHTTDEILTSRGTSHEEKAAKIIRNTEIEELLTEEGLDPAEICDLIMGSGRLSKIISSEIDVDKMDYLVRDSYYAGVAYGTIDLERIIYGIKLVDGDLVVRRGGLEAVEFLLICRNMMYQTVYRHHTKRIIEAMFKKALNSVLGKKLKYAQFLEMDDVDLIYNMRKAGGYAGEIMRRIDERRLFKTFFQEKMVLIEDAFKEDLVENKEKIERKIERDFNIKRGYVLLDIPQSKMSEFKVLVETEAGYKRIDEVSSLARTLEKSENEKLTLSIYTAPEYLPNLEDFNAEKYIEFTQTRLKKFI